MQNLSQNEPEQIVRMKNFLQNDFEKIAKMRRIRKYKNMSKDESLIFLLNSKKSHTELYKSKSNNVETEETKVFFNELRNKFSKSQIKKIEKSYTK